MEVERGSYAAEMIGVHVDNYYRDEAKNGDGLDRGGFSCRSHT